MKKSKKDPVRVRLGCFPRLGRSRQQTQPVNRRNPRFRIRIHGPRRRTSGLNAPVADRRFQRERSARPTTFEMLGMTAPELAAVAPHHGFELRFTGHGLHSSTCGRARAYIPSAVMAKQRQTGRKPCPTLLGDLGGLTGGQPANLPTPREPVFRQRRCVLTMCRPRRHKRSFAGFSSSASSSGPRVVTDAPASQGAQLRGIRHRHLAGSLPIQLPIQNPPKCTAESGKRGPFTTRTKGLTGGSSVS